MQLCIKNSGTGEGNCHEEGNERIKHLKSINDSGGMLLGSSEAR